MKVSINTRYLGVVLIILSVILFLIMYNFSQTMLEIIDSGELGSCQSYETCPHVMILNQAYLGYFLALVIFIVGVFLLIFGGRPEKVEGNKRKWESVLKTLTGDERGIYDKIVASEGVIFQSELVEQTGFPKAKVSRVLDKMEARGLLERKRRGMTNAVVLK
ncbi:MAG: MarR family transcriptional regulator [Candidatus Aenigmarchaeota archaeon]|nr:MarR family transcriptional regulator [Candidatus Aenigmarchaeota archaeon]